MEAQELKVDRDRNRFGLSKKTNIAIAAMTALSTAQDSWQAVVAITIIAVVGLSIQGVIDYRKQS